MDDKKQSTNDLETSVTCNSNLGSFSDNAIMHEIQSGNGDALTVVFDRYHRLVLTVALRILRDLGEAEDVMQAIFLEIFQKAAQFDSAKGTLDKWILQYAYHRSINRKSYLTLRQFYRSHDLPDDTEDTFVTSVSPSQEDTYLVQQSLALLTPQQREVIELVFFKEMTFREIAAQTKQSFAIVRHLHYRGLQRLREKLSGTARGNKKQASAGLEEVDPANA
jgi:RNA polymerase sigma-70 factor (ECF subfamily)